MGRRPDPLGDDSSAQKCTFGITRLKVLIEHYTLIFIEDIEACVCVWNLVGGRPSDIHLIARGSMVETFSKAPVEHLLRYFKSRSCLECHAVKYRQVCAIRWTPHLPQASSDVTHSSAMTTGVDSPLLFPSTIDVLMEIAMEAVLRKHPSRPQHPLVRLTFVFTLALEQNSVCKTTNHFLYSLVANTKLL